MTERMYHKKIVCYSLWFDLFLLVMLLELHIKKKNSKCTHIRNIHDRDKIFLSLKMYCDENK